MSEAVRRGSDLERKVDYVLPRLTKVYRFRTSPMMCVA